MHLSHDFSRSISSKRYSLLTDVTTDTEITLMKTHTNTTIMWHSSLGSRYFSIRSSMASVSVPASDSRKKSDTQYLQELLSIRYQSLFLLLRYFARVNFEEILRSCSLFSLHLQQVSDLSSQTSFCQKFLQSLRVSLLPLRVDHSSMSRLPTSFQSSMHKLEISMPPFFFLSLDVSG